MSYQIDVVHIADISIISGIIISASGSIVSVSGQPVTTSVSGNIVSANISGNVVNTSVSGQAINVLSGQMQIVSGVVSVSGNFVNTSVSGQPVSTSVSGNIVSANISGNFVNTSVSGNIINTSGQVALISGQPVNVTSGVFSVSGNFINTSVSGNIVQISGQSVNAVVTTDISGQSVVITSGVVSVSGNWVNTSISGNVVSTTVTTDISGQSVNVTSGQIQIMSGRVTVSGNYVNTSISGNVVVASVVTNISGNVVVAEVSGNVVVTSVSGNLVLTSVSGNVITTSTSGNIIITSVSGNQIRFGTSGFSYTNVQAFDYTNTTFVNVAANVSGVLSISGPVTTSTSGNVVVTSTSGNIISTSISGNIINMSGQVAVISGQPLNIVSGQVQVMSGVVTISGNVVITSVSGNIVNTSGQATSVSGQPINVVSGQVQVMSGVVTISGNVVSTSISGNQVRLQAIDISGGVAFPLYINTSGQVLSGVPHRLIVGFSGDNVVVANTVTVAGAVTTSVSGNIVNTSGQVSIISGQPVNVVSGQIQIVSGVVSISGNTIALNQLVTATVSGNTVTISGNIVVAQTSGQLGRIAGVQGSGIHTELLDSKHAILAYISGQSVTASVVTNISGQVVVAEISGQTVTVSGNSIVVALISGQDGAALRSGANTIMIAGTTATTIASVAQLGAADNVQITAANALYVNNANYGWDETASRFNRLRITASGSAGAGGGTLFKLLTCVSGDPVNITSGQVQVMSGTVTISGNSINVTSGQVQVMSGTVTISGNTVVAKVSGELARIADVQGSGFHSELLNSKHAILAYISGQTVNAVASANISGQTIATWPTSGQNAVYLTAQSGNVLQTTSSGQLLVSISGNVVDLALQPVVARMAGFDGSSFQFISTNAAGGTRLQATISGDSIKTFAASGQNSVYLSTQSGSAPIATHTPNDNTGGEISLVTIANLMARDPTSFNFNRLATTISGTAASQGGTVFRLLTCISGDPVTISGNVVNTSISGNAVSISGNSINVVSGQVTVIDAGGVNKLVIDTAGTDERSTASQFAQVQSVLYGFDSVSTNRWRRIGSTASGTAASQGGIVFRLLTHNTPSLTATKPTLIIPGASGGVPLLSGAALQVTIRNIGVSGTVMYVGGTGPESPWVASGQAAYPFISGLGMWIRDGDAVTVPCSGGSMASVRVVSHTSGQYISYMGVGY